MHLIVMSKRLATIWLFTCCLVGCNDQVELKEETDPNGLYIPYLTSKRNDGKVTLNWGKPGCLYCGTCPCPQLNPDYFEVLYSNSGMADLEVYTVVDNDIFEATIDGLTNGIPGYFAIRAVISGIKYTQSSAIMVIPNSPENVHQLFQIIDKDVKLGSWSPDQSSITYVADYESTESVYMSSVNGANSLLVEKSSRSPEWSPVGDKITYHTENGEVNTSPGYRPTHIAVYGVNDNISFRLTTGNSFNYLPSWSPDGEWIAYLSDKAKGNEFNIWMVHSSDGTTLKVTSDFNDLNDLAIIDDRSPKTLSWSSDGKSIAFARLTGNPLNTDIYSVSIDGDNLQTIITSPWNDNYPSYSPDGNLVAFISDRSGLSEIWTMDLQSQELSQITGSTELIYVNSGKLEWSSSGNKILFTGSENGFNKLYSVDVE